MKYTLLCDEFCVKGLMRLSEVVRVVGIGQLVRLGWVHPLNGGADICVVRFPFLGGFQTNFEIWFILPCILLKEAKKKLHPI